MKISDKTYVLILIIMILSLSFVNYWRFQNFRLILPKIELPKIEIPKIESELFPESEEKEEWISPDGKLKLTYSASWQEMNQDIFKQASGAGIILAESETLLFAHRFKLQEQAFALLTVIQVSAKKNLEEITEEIKKSVEKEKGETEITILEIEDGIVHLEMISKYPNQSNFYLKGKIIFGDEKAYLVVFTSPQKDWPQFEEEAKEILDSVHLL